MYSCTIDSIADQYHISYSTFPPCSKWHLNNRTALTHVKRASCVPGRRDRRSRTCSRRPTVAHPASLRAETRRSTCGDPESTDALWLWLRPARVAPTPSAAPATCAALRRNAAPAPSADDARSIFLTPFRSPIHASFHRTIPPGTASAPPIRGFLRR